MKSLFELQNCSLGRVTPTLGQYLDIRCLSEIGRVMWPDGATTVQHNSNALKATLASKLSEIETRIAGSLSFYDSELHGLSHLREVAMLAGEIAARSDGDIEAAMVAGMLHDCGRMNDGGGNQHAIDSALLAKSVLSEHYSHLDADGICEAIARHADGETTGDPLAGALWDTDRLTLTRLGRRVDPALLSTPAGRKLLSERNSKSGGR